MICLSLMGCAIEHLFLFIEHKFLFYCEYSVISSTHLFTYEKIETHKLRVNQ